MSSSPRDQYFGAAGRAGIPGPYSGIAARAWHAGPTFAIRHLLAASRADDAGVARLFLDPARLRGRRVLLGLQRIPVAACFFGTRLYRYVRRLHREASRALHDRPNLSDDLKALLAG